MLMGRDISGAVNSPSELSILPQAFSPPALHSCPKAVLKLVPLPQVVRVTLGTLGYVGMCTSSSSPNVHMAARWLPKERAVLGALKESVGVRQVQPLPTVGGCFPRAARPAVRASGPGP